MSRFYKLSHTIWHCQYHIVWTPKYRFKILKDGIKAEVETCIRIFSEQMQCRIIELNVQIDHVHLIVMIPPKVMVSKYVGTIKGRSAIRIFCTYPNLRKKPYWGNHFWAEGYCVDSVGLDLEMICKYVKYQEEKEKYFECKV